MALEVGQEGLAGEVEVADGVVVPLWQQQEGSWVLVAGGCWRVDYWWVAASCRHHPALLLMHIGVWLIQ